MLFFLILTPTVLTVILVLPYSKPSLFFELSIAILTLSKLRKYYMKTKLPIFIEWICLKENLTDDHAKELIKIMKKVPSKLKLIEFNPLSNKNFKAASQENIDKFSNTIQEAGFLSLFRRSRGRDINASCGSLANKKT